MSHARAFGRLQRLDRSDTCSNDGINLHRSIPLSCALWCHSVGAFQTPGHLFLLRFNIQSRCWKGDTFTNVYWYLVLVLSKSLKTDLNLLKFVSEVASRSWILVAAKASLRVHSFQAEFEQSGATLQQMGRAQWEARLASSHIRSWLEIPRPVPP